MVIERIDHVVLTVRSLEATCRFYCDVLGAEVIEVEGRPTALSFGRAKINVHEVDRTFEPKAAVPTPGSGDLCLITDWEIGRVVEHLSRMGVLAELGPVERHGALGPMTSVYVRDPDGNLVEVSRYAR